MRPPTDAGTGAPVSFGRFPSLIAWLIVAALLVLTGSRWPQLAYGTLALALLYLLVTNTDRVGELGDAITSNFAAPLSR